MSLFQALSAGDLCARNVVFAHRDMALGEAAQRMREHHVGCLVVVDDSPAGRLPVGLLTDRDIVIAVVAQDLDVRTLRVGDVMSATPVPAREAESLLDSLGAMRRAGVRRLPVGGRRPRPPAGLADAGRRGRSRCRAAGRAGAGAAQRAPARAADPALTDGARPRPHQAGSKRTTSSWP